MKYLVLSCVLILIALINGCTSSLVPFRPEPATLSPKTSIYKELGSLPMPKDKIVAAVYKFRDETGQYKLSNTGTSWSTAVTQGATSILMKALEESNWFIPIEREGLSNLLNERKIIRSSRANFKGSNGEELPPLPPLLYAGVLLEGGIISYETNLITGGVGVKYFGTGASNQYREDKITVCLRAISTQNGRVLKTVTTSKTILSQMVDVGVFKYVDFQRLLEIETGFSYNEPVDMCVAEAIEKSVCCMVFEGIKDKLWEPAAMNDSTMNMLQKYEEEKASARSFDYSEKLLEPGNRSGIFIEGGPMIIQSDYPNARTSGFAGIGFITPLSNQFKVSASGGWGTLRSESFFHLETYQALLSLRFDFAPFNHLNPFLYAGIGGIFYYYYMDFGKRINNNSATGLFNYGVGFEI